MRSRGCLAPLLAGLLLAPGCAGPSHEAADWTILDGRATARARVHAYTEHDAIRTLDEIRTALGEAESKLFPGNDSALDRLNRGAAADYHVVDDKDLYRCVLLALDYAKTSMGTFDPTVGSLTALYERHTAAGTGPPGSLIDSTLASVAWESVGVAYERRAIRFRRRGMRLDLGGVAKGFALDMAARAFARPGVLGGVIEIGGNAYAWGEAPDEAGWIVTMPDPRESGVELLRVRLANRGIAVSGRSPVLDPVTGRPAATDLIAAVGIADSGGDADAVSTALFVSGSLRGSALLQKLRRVEAILVVRGNGEPPHVLASASLAGRLELAEPLIAETGGRVRYLLPPERL